MAEISLPIKFSFYSVYMNDLNKLNVFQFRKVIKALVEYSKTRELPDKLSNKGMAVFLKIQPVIDEENRQIAAEMAKKIAGHKGAKKRWNSRNGKPMAETKQNHSKRGEE